MCGISLIIQKKAGKPAGDEAIRKMNRAQAHRGPDGYGFHFLRWNNHNLWFGHNLLSITGTKDSGRQPMLTRDGNCGIIFNGEIYNSAELRKGLEEKGLHFDSQTDSEVLLYLLRESGAEGIPLLEGMFAFIFWDSQREELLLARDRFGTKPLYFAENDNYLLCASEPAGLFASGLMSFRPDESAIASYLNYKFIPGGRSEWKEINEVIPGQILRYYNGRLSSIPARKELGPSPESSLSSAMNKAFSEVIPSDQAFALALSGGIDSGLILAWCLKNGRKPEIFSIRFPEGSSTYPDTRAVMEMAAMHRLKIHWIDYKESDFFDFAGCRQASDFLIADPAFILTKKIASAAAEMGIRILISGAGADEWFGGYRRHVFMQRWLRLSRFLPVSICNRAVSLAKPGKLKYIDGKFTGTLFLWQAAVSSRLNSSLRNLQGLEPAGAVNPEAFLRWDQQHYLPQDILKVTDLAGMSAGVEARFPFLHSALTSFAEAQPTEEKTGNSGKKLLRDAFASEFGKKAAGRKKQGFGFPLPAFLRADNKELLEEMLLTIEGLCPGLFDGKNWPVLRRKLIKEPSAFLPEWLALSRLAQWLPLNQKPADAAALP